MKFNNPNAGLFVPDGAAESAAIARITHLGIGAHQDDLEFMAFHGILECFADPENWFGGVTCTNGGGCARTGPYREYTNEDMMAIRRREQDAAAVIGQYGVMIQLDHASSAVKEPKSAALREDLAQILSGMQPRVVYTHNPADKHDTHIGVVVAVLEALRGLPRDRRPGRVIGCEVWRDLDWLPDAEKVVMDVSGRDNLAAALNGVFDSQVAGGKRYDLAAIGRRAANASFFESHASDTASQLSFGMDLTPLVEQETMDIADYACGFIEKFNADVRRKIRRQLGHD